MQPFVCPVCVGRGIVSPFFYNWTGIACSGNNEQCRSCSGTGIVWGPPELNELEQLEGLAGTVQKPLTEEQLKQMDCPLLKEDEKQ